MSEKGPRTARPMTRAERDAARDAGLDPAELVRNHERVDVFSLYTDDVRSAFREAMRIKLGLAEDPRGKIANRGELSMIRYGFQQRMWDAQKAIVSAVMQRRLVTVRSCRKAGKTHAGALLVGAFVQCAPSIVITTAPTQRQVKMLLWGKIRSMHRDARVPMLGTVTTMGIDVTDDHYAVGFATNDADRFQGIHAGVVVPDDVDPVTPNDPNDPIGDPIKPEVMAENVERAAFAAKRSGSRLLFVIDEAPGVPAMLLEAIRGSLVGDNTYAVMLGNPTIAADDEHDYARSHAAGSRWHRIKIRSELATDEVPIDPVTFDQEFITPRWLVARGALEGEFPRDTRMHNPYVLGQFIDPSFSNRVVTWDMLKAAAEPRDSNWKRGPHVGFDTSAEGSDANVATLYVDSVKVSVDQWHSPDTLKTWDRMKMLRSHWQAQLCIDIPWKHVHIDDAPIAKGIIDIARRDGCYLDCVSFGGAPTLATRSVTGSVEYVNRRAELYWTLRELLRTQKACIPEKYVQSWRELSAHQYELDTRGRLLIEPKDKVKARLGKSPDHADADVLAFATAPRIAMYRA